MTSSSESTPDLSLPQEIIKNFDNRLPGAIATCLLRVAEELFTRNIITSIKFKRNLLKGKETKQEKADKLVDKLFRIYDDDNREHFQSLCKALKEGAKGEGTLERIAQSMWHQYKMGRAIIQEPSRDAYQEIFDTYSAELPGAMVYQLGPILDELHSKGVIGWELKHDIIHGAERDRLGRAEYLVDELDGLLSCDDNPKQFLTDVCEGLEKAAEGKISLTHLAKEILKRITKLKT